MSVLTFHINDDKPNTTSYFFGNDPYIEQFWLPFLGPTATLLLRNLSILALIKKPWFDYDAEELSRILGTGKRSSVSSPVIKQLSRLNRFGLIKQQNTQSILISPWVPTLNQDLVLKLPSNEKIRHHEWLEKITANHVHTFSKRLEHLITGMELMGIANEEIVIAVLNSGMHPSIIGKYIKDIDNKRGVA